MGTTARRVSDREALEDVLRAVRDDVFNLAQRMLGCPEDAADATQEVLLKVTTHLATFRGESSLRTWVWTIATRHVLSVRRSRVEREAITFASLGEELARGLVDVAADWDDDPEQLLLAEEVKVTCTQAMLGLVDPALACRCERRVPAALAAGHVPLPLTVVDRAPARRAPDVRREVREIEDLERIAAIFRSHPTYATPGAVVDGVRATLDAGRHAVLR